MAKIYPLSLVHVRYHSLQCVRPKRQNGICMSNLMKIRLTDSVTTAADYQTIQFTTSNKKQRTVTVTVAACIQPVSMSD